MNSLFLKLSNEQSFSIVVACHPIWESISGNITTKSMKMMLKWVNSICICICNFLSSIKSLIIIITCINNNILVFLQRIKKSIAWGRINKSREKEIYHRIERMVLPLLQPTSMSLGLEFGGEETNWGNSFNK